LQFIFCLCRPTAGVKGLKIPTVLVRIQS